MGRLKTRAGVDTQSNNLIRHFGRTAIHFGLTLKSVDYIFVNLYLVGVTVKTLVGKL